MPQSVSLPCNINFAYDGTHAVIPNLGSYNDLGTKANGTVAVVDSDNKVVSVIEVAKLLGDKGHQHPHDAVFLPNGDIVVCTWWVMMVVRIIYTYIHTYIHTHIYVCTEYTHA